MSLIRTLTLAMLTVALPFSPTLAAEVEDEGTFVVEGDTLSPTPMTATANGSTVSYEGKIVAWPTASVKVLTFKKANGGVLHPLTDEQIVFVLEGRLQTTVGGDTVTLEAGDLASKPTGFLTNPGQPEDAKIIAWTAGSLTPGATAAVVRGSDVEAETGGPVRVKRYQFPGNSVRHVTLPADLQTNPGSAKTDSLIYIISGQRGFEHDGQDFTVSAGDFIREVAELKHFWKPGEDTVFVTTSALPEGSGPIDPSQATDRPPAN